MANKFNLVLVLFIVSVFCSCKKNDYTTFAAPDQSITTTNVDKGFAPATANSYVKYRVSASSSTATTVDTTMNVTSGTTTTINDKVYNVINVKSAIYGSSQGFYSNANHVYTARAVYPGTSTTLELQYLVDNLPEGGTWTAPVTDNGAIKGYPAQIIGTIAEKGISYTVSGIKFNNVIHTVLQLQYNIANTGFTTYGSFDYYIADGVGIIQINSSVVLPGSSTINSVASVIAYDIK